MSKPPVTEDIVMLVALLDLDSVGGGRESGGVTVRRQQKGVWEGRTSWTAHVDLLSGPRKWGGGTDLLNVELATFRRRKWLSK
jgi:hypothetical protein